MFNSQIARIKFDRILIPTHHYSLRMSTKRDITFFTYLPKITPTCLKWLNLIIFYFYFRGKNKPPTYCMTSSYSVHSALKSLQRLASASLSVACPGAVYEIDYLCRSYRIYRFILVREFRSNDAIYFVSHWIIWTNVGVLLWSSSPVYNIELREDFTTVWYCLRKAKQLSHVTIIN